MSLRSLAFPLLAGALAASACVEPSDDAADDLADQDPGDPDRPRVDCAEIGWGGDHCQPTRYPIVLAHGFNAAPDSIWSYNQVKVLLEADGHVVYEPAVEPFRSVADRAETLRRAIDGVLAETGAAKVNIVA